MDTKNKIQNCLFAPQGSKILHLHCQGVGDLTGGDAYEGGGENTSNARSLMKKQFQPNKYDERTNPTQRVNEKTRTHFPRRVPGRLEAKIN